MKFSIIHVLLVFCSLIYGQENGNIDKSYLIESIKDDKIAALVNATLVAASKATEENFNNYFIDKDRVQYKKSWLNMLGKDGSAMKLEICDVHESGDLIVAIGKMSLDGKAKDIDPIFLIKSSGNAKLLSTYHKDSVYSELITDYSIKHEECMKWYNKNEEKFR